MTRREAIRCQLLQRFQMHWCGIDSGLGREALYRMDVRSDRGVLLHVIYSCPLPLVLPATIPPLGASRSICVETVMNPVIQNWQGLGILSKCNPSPDSSKDYVTLRSPSVGPFFCTSLATPITSCPAPHKLHYLVRHLPISLTQYNIWRPINPSHLRSVRGRQALALWRAVGEGE